MNAYQDNLFSICLPLTSYFRLGFPVTVMKSLLYTITFLSLGFAQGRLQNASMHSDVGSLNSDLHFCGAPIFTEEYIENQREKMKNLFPDTYERMQMPPALNKSYEIGMTEKFWVTIDDTVNIGQTLDVEITARLLTKGSKVAIWGDVNEIGLSNSNINETTAAEFLRFMEESTPEGSLDTTKGAYDVVKTYFGNEPNKDGDGITDYLFYEMFSGAAGYFSGSDQGNGAGSNQRDILYMDSRISMAFAKSTMAHELQHLLHYSYTNKGRKFNEGMSEVASVITGTGNPGFSPNSYLSNVGQTGWSFELTGEHYSMGGLFVLYFAEQFGFPSLLKFQEIDATDLQALQRLLNIYEAGVGISGWFKQWHLANLFNDKSINPIYGYDYDRVGKANPTFIHNTGTIESTDNSVLNYDANYIEFGSTSAPDSLPITFTTSSGEFNYTAIEFTDDSTFIKTLKNGEKHIAENPNRTVNKALFVVSNARNFDGYYGYKSEGENTGGWYDQIDIAYDDGAVDVFQLSGGGSFGYFGCGPYPGCGWGVEFDPRVGENQLLSTSINLGFAQDFSSGSSIPASAGKSFMLHVWKVMDESGNVQDLMPPIEIDAKARGINGIGWANIDLTPYADDLTNISKIIIGATEDDTNAVYFGMSNDTPNNDYSYRFSGGSVSSMTGISVSGGDIIGPGWDLMFRTSWLVKNTTIPNLHAGYVQNSVFNDRLKIYLLGNSIFNDDDTNIYITNEGEVEFLETSPLASNDSILVADFKLKSSGKLDIRASGTYLYSTMRYDTTFQYNVGYAVLSKPLITSSRDNVYSINMAKNSLNEDTYLVVGKNAYANNNSLETDLALSDIYTVSPINTKLNAPAQISFDLKNTNLTDISIGYWNGELWEELPTYESSDRSFVYANSNFLGHFALIKKGSGSALSTIESEIVPTEYALEQNYPNPFNPETRISYDIAEAGEVSLIVYDILGRKIVELVNEFKTPGRYNILWTGNDVLGNSVGSGIYLYQLRSRSYSKTKKMVISR